MRAKKPRSACPNCSRDLGAKPTGSRSPYKECPFCQTPIIPIWWQRLLFSGVGLILAFVVPAFLGLTSILLLIGALVCLFPALVIAYVLVFKTISPKYVTKSGSTMTLFRR
jgi:hypothetical protein